MATYSIDVFDFLHLESVSGRGGAPILPQTHQEIIQRPGVDGTGFVTLGSKGMPFLMRSRIDVQTEIEAQALIYNYRQIAGTRLVSLVWRDVDFLSTHGVQFNVLGVTDDTIQVMACLTGGLYVPDGNPGYIVEVTWHLIAVAV